MRALRFWLSVIVLLLLAFGYAGSQYFALNGRAQEWTLLVDTPGIVWTSLLVLLVAIALWAMRDREPLENEE